MYKFLKNIICFFIGHKYELKKWKLVHQDWWINKCSRCGYDFAEDSPPIEVLEYLYRDK